jgi:hypothetical protein
MTPEEVKSRLAGDPSYDMWDEEKQLWFCERVVGLRSVVGGMKGPDYSAPLAKLKSSLRKAIAAEDCFGIEIIEYVADDGDISRAIMELQVFRKMAERLLAMPKPEHMIELTATGETEPSCGYSGGGDTPGGRRAWRNGVVTEMVHELIESAGIAVTRTGKSIYSEGSPSMKLMVRVFDCLDPRTRRRTTDTVLKRIVRTRGKKVPKK